MATATMTSKGQMTVPRVIRERLRIGAGDRLDFVVNDQDEVIVRPAKGDISSLRGLLALPRSRKRVVKIADMETAILGSHARRG
jgi:AbrB family looped-hinge helix DNA binding protein